MTSPVYEETYRDHTIKIFHDPDPINPRDWDNFGTLICSHPRYNLGDKHRFDGAHDFLLHLCGLSSDSKLSINQLFRRAQKQAVILPVYLYDHSGLAMNTTGFSCPWDSGQIGFIHVTHEKIRSDYNVSRVSALQRVKVTEILKQEVDTYSDYVGGNAFGFVIEKEDDEVDACWGFIGDYDGFCLEEARSAID